MLRRNRDKKLRKKYFEIWELNNEEYMQVQVQMGRRGVGRQESGKQ